MAFSIPLVKAAPACWPSSIYPLDFNLLPTLSWKIVSAAPCTPVFLLTFPLPIEPLNKSPFNIEPPIFIAPIMAPIFIKDLTTPSNPFPGTIVAIASLILLIIVKNPVRASTPDLTISLLAIFIINSFQAFLRLFTLASIDSKVFSNCFCDAPLLFFVALTNSIVLS